MTIKDSFTRSLQSMKIILLPLKSNIILYYLIFHFLYWYPYSYRFSNFVKEIVVALNLLRYFFIVFFGFIAYFMYCFFFISLSTIMVAIVLLKAISKRKERLITVDSKSNNCRESIDEKKLMAKNKMKQRRLRAIT